MSTDEIIGGVLESLFESGKEGLFMEMTDTFFTSGVIGLEEVFKEKYPERFKTPFGRKCVKAALPVLILSLLKISPRGYFPKEKILFQMCRYAIRNTSLSTLKEILPLIRPIMKRLAILAAKSTLNVLDDSPLIEDDGDSVIDDSDLDD